ncbi:hypothetical protein FIBSPDRAFT_172436 [Athelia psychrophila]|uniref:TPR-like protein n=1 Tax=Athelia psychrophila TaxID=1759441 RepID=A0A166AV98_9AGAM|nr:hypothetical protein FIBSPDRAFT_172436 [Fibularhizoctonia sp. CBS 109695]
MLLSRKIKTPASRLMQRVHPLIRMQHVLQRNYSSSQTPASTPKSSSAPAPVYSDNLAQHTVYGLSIYGRLFKYTAVALLGFGTLAWTAFEGTHLYVEAAKLSPETDEEVKKWGWDEEADIWSGGEAGGTDPGLGFKGRHAVRSAWMALNWGIGPGSSVIGSNAFSGKGPSGAGGLNIVDARLEFAQDYISMALAIAQERSHSGKIHPQTPWRLLVRHAAILERMGSQASWFEARSELEKVWAQIPKDGSDAGRTALKLGDLNHRLGDVEDALAWWARAIQLTQGDHSKDTTLVSPVVPKTAPTSPLAQRTLISTLISLSAHYATSGQLKQAQAVEESSLELLRAIAPPQSQKLASAPEALHVLYVLHRSSLLSIHLAEVLFGLRSPTTTSLQHLTNAATASERVALALTGLPSIHPDAPQSQIPHPPASESPLMKIFTGAPSLSKPATSLLRDARRTAAEAWNLMGVLHEQDGGNSKPEKALECYERALGWAGVAADRPGAVADAGDGILETEWKVFWANYVRARDVVRNRRQDK